MARTDQPGRPRIGRAIAKFLPERPAGARGIAEAKTLVVSLAIATNILSALTGSASGRLTIALNALGGTVVTLLAVCDSTHGTSYFDIVMVGIVGALLALAVVIVLGSMLGSF